MEASPSVYTEKMSGVKRCAHIISLIDPLLELEPIIIDEYQEKLDALREYSGLCWWKVDAGEMTAVECEEAITYFERWIETGNSS